MISTFIIKSEFDDAYLTVYGEKFFPATQDRIRKLWANWIYPTQSLYEARAMVNYIAQRMDQIKENWQARNLDTTEWARQPEAPVYRNLERNATLLQTYIERNKRDVKYRPYV